MAEIYTVRLSEVVEFNVKADNVDQVDTLISNNTIAELASKYNTTINNLIEYKDEIVCKVDGPLTGYEINIATDEGELDDDDRALLNPILDRDLYRIERDNNGNKIIVLEGSFWYGEDNGAGPYRWEGYCWDDDVRSFLEDYEECCGNIVDIVQSNTHYMQDLTQADVVKAIKEEMKDRQYLPFDKVSEFVECGKYYG